MKNALRLDLITARDLRTPRTVVETLDADRSVRDLLADVETWIHSRVPVLEGDDADRIVGLVHRREVLDAALRRPDEELFVRDLLRPIRFVPETMPANELLEHFIADRAHMVAVVDEYGGFEGVVTLEDVLECLLGAEIVDEHDEIEDMQSLARARGEKMRPEGHTPSEESRGSEDEPPSDGPAGGEQRP